GIGDVQSASGDYIEYVVINHCTIAITPAGALAAQALAFQAGSTWTFNNITVTNCYFAGFGYTIETGASYPTTQPTNYTFTGNVIGPTPTANYGVMSETPTTAFNTSGSGNQWRNNTFIAGTYTIRSGSGGTFQST